MPVFNYQSRTQKGEVQVGRVEAPNRKVAADILQRHGFIVVALEEAKDVPIYARRIKFFEKIKSRDVVIFSRQLTTLFEAEVPLVTSIQTVANQTESKLLQEKLFEIAADIEGGAPLSDAIAKHPNVFSDFYIHMVRAGEATGKLDEVLDYLSDHLEREHEINSRVKGAMIYPAFVVSGFFLAVIVMMVFVVPQLTQILEDSGQELPFLTKIIINSSRFMQSFWYFVIIGVVGGGIFFRRYIKTDSGKKFWDRAQLKIPVFGNILKKVYIYRFTDSLSTLIEGGLPITRALMISGDVTGNTVYKDIIKDAREKVQGGGTIGGALFTHDEIPPLVVQMISVGEQAGKLVQVLGNVSDFYKKEVDNLVDNITSLIEPVLLVVMGIGVAILVAGIMLPIYNMAGSQSL